MKEETNLSPMTKRLDAIIRLLLHNMQAENKTTSREQIGILNSVGLDYKEIASIMGRSGSYVGSELTLLKGKKAKNMKG